MLEQEKSPQNQVPQDDDTGDQEAENGEVVPRSQETQPEEKTSRIVQEHDHTKQEDQLLAGEPSKSAMEEVREKIRPNSIAINYGVLE